MILFDYELMPDIILHVDEKRRLFKWFVRLYNETILFTFKENTRVGMYRRFLVIFKGKCSRCFYFLSVMMVKTWKVSRMPKLPAETEDGIEIKCQYEVRFQMLLWVTCQYREFHCMSSFPVQEVCINEKKIIIFSCFQVVCWQDCETPQ